MNRPKHEIDAYLEGNLTAEQARTLDAWITADPANAAAFLHLVQTHQALGVIGQERKRARVAAELAPDQLDPVTLASLAQMEASAEPMAFEEIDQPFRFESTPAAPSQKSADLAQTLDDLRWAAGKAVARLIRSPLSITAGLAAMIVLGLFLIAPWSDQPDLADNTNPTTPPASVDPTPRVSEPNARPTVATLTAEHDALWAESALAPGSQLRAGDRLTLTQGFAEIRTNRGAIAILQAPATIELLDNDNALYLHAGQLTGVCDRPSSKGLIIQTPLATVRDVSTRFGVQHAEGQTQVSVMQGSVVATASAGDTDPEWIDLLEGQHAAIAQGADELRRVDRPTLRYVYDWSAVAEQPRVTGQARLESTMPVSVIPGGQEDDWPVVYAERSGVRLPAGFEFTINAPGEYIHSAPIDPFPLAQGTVADCYFIHFDVPGQPQSPATITATLHFDRPIVGVITLPDHLLASGELLDRKDVTYRNAVVPDGMPAVEGLDVTPTHHDIIRISEDRRTLEFELSTGPFTDQFRVLVQAEQEVTQ